MSESGTESMCRDIIYSLGMVKPGDAIRDFGSTFPPHHISCFE
jgi:hypothetical protein